ncbi:MAG: hypothetical protein H6759_02555 [Candidatus Nomurabacteria bacterium]|nr:MAG: hypothetical protein H6759_02555 [Candidatus Nomurabacteria bacterium]
MQELGANQKEMSLRRRISVLPVTYSAAVKRIAANAQISVLQDELVRRLRDLLVSLITGVRNDDTALEFLQKENKPKEV